MHGDSEWLQLKFFKALLFRYQGDIKKYRVLYKDLGQTIYIIQRAKLLVAVRLFLQKQEIMVDELYVCCCESDEEFEKLSKVCNNLFEIGRKFSFNSDV